MEKKLKIALVNQPWGYIVPPVHEGGSIPIILYETARRLAVNHDVTIFTRSRFGTEVRYDQNVRYQYVPVAADKLIIKVIERLPAYADPRCPWWASKLAYIGYAVQVARALRRENYDIVHLNNLTQFVPIFRFFNPTIKIAVHMHCEWLNQLDRKLIGGRLAETDMVTGVSDFITGRVRDAFPQHAGRCHTIYNGVDVEQFTPGDRDARMGRPLTLAYVGRISPEKGIHTLIDAFKIASQRFPDLRLDLIGPDEINLPELIVDVSNDRKLRDMREFFIPGRYRAHLHGMLDAGCRDRVRFLGNVPHSTGLVERYRDGNICVFPSIPDEPFGIPVVEAMATGAPVVATRCGAFPELVAHGQTGLLAEPGDAVSLAEALNHLLGDDSLRRSMGAAGRQRAVDLFSWDSIVQTLRRRYEELMRTEPEPVSPSWKNDSVAAA